MIISITDQERTVMAAAKQKPSVSIIMSFEHINASKDDMAHRLKLAVEKAKRDLLLSYSEQTVAPVISKLQNLTRNIDYKTAKKSLGLFVSPQTESALYLNAVVNDRIVIDDSFGIRDLVYEKKLDIQYLLLLLSGNSYKFYLGNDLGFFPIDLKVPDNIHAYQNDAPERVANFSDPGKHKEDTLNKFLHHIDLGLTDALKMYQLPLFIVSAERVFGHFKKISKNVKSLAEFIHGNHMDATEAELRALMQPYIENWRTISQQNILKRLQKAKDANKLAFGPDDVWASVQDKNNKLLAVEKDFRHPLRPGDKGSYYINDAVDNIIEKVLANGGDVEFVDNGSLKEYKHIALIPYY